VYDDWRPAGPELWVVIVQLSREETNRLATLTRSNIGNQLNILWRGKVLFAPTIREEVKNGRLEITRNSKQEGEALDRELEGESTSERAKDR